MTRPADPAPPHTDSERPPHPLQARVRALIRAGFRIGVGRDGLSFDPEPDPPFEALVAALQGAYTERFAACQGLAEALGAAENEHVGLYVKDATAEGALILRPSGARGLLWPDIFIEPIPPADPAALRS